MHINKKNSRKLFASTMSGLLLSTVFINPSILAHADELDSNNIQEQITEEKPQSMLYISEEKNPEEIINTVQSFVEVNDEGHIKLIEDIPASVYEDYQLSNLENHFTDLNKAVDNGSITINKNLDIVENSSLSNFSSNELTTMSTTTTSSSKYFAQFTYWWGRRTKYTKVQATAASRAFRDYSLGYVGVAGVGVFVPGIGGIIAAAGTLSSAHASLVSNKISDKNIANGVTLDMTWVLAFTTTTIY